MMSFNGRKKIVCNENQLDETPTDHRPLDNETVPAFFLRSKHCPTLLDGVGRCLINVDCVGCWSANNIGFRYHARIYGVLLIRRAKMLDDVG